VTLTLLLILCATGLLLYWYAGSAMPDRQLIAEQKGGDREQARPGEPSVPSTGLTSQSQVEHGRGSAPAQRSPTVSPSQRARVTNNRPRAVRSQPHSVSAETVEVKRSPVPVPASKQLLAVKNVYVDPLVMESAADGVRRALVVKLGASGRFVVVVDRENADAVFKGSVRRRRKARGWVSVSLRLVNAQGLVVWSGEAQGHDGTHSGGRTDVAAELINELLAEIKKQEGRR
jgi:hypothetical protein